jgi:hypothetical protein
MSRARFRRAAACAQRDDEHERGRDREQPASARFLTGGTRP